MYINSYINKEIARGRTFMHIPEVEAYEDAFQFCGCGRTDLAHIYVMDMLSSIDREETDCKGSDYFFFYWADNKGLTEHGGGVPGWLTKAGKQVLQDLHTMYAEGLI